MSTTSVLDHGVLDELLASLGGDTAFLAELIDTYLSDAPSLLAQLHSALTAQSADEFRRAAHTLKSSSASLGAYSLSATAKEMELMGKEGKLDSAGEKLSLAEAEFGRIRDELEKAKSTTGG